MLSLGHGFECTRTVFKAGRSDVPRWCAWFLVAMVLIGVVGMAAVLWAAEITLSWNPNTESDLAGYKIYQSTLSGQYGAPVATIGTVTQHTLALPALTVDQTYFFSVTAYDVSGNESGKSNEVSTVVAGLAAIPIPTEFRAVTVDGVTTLSWKLGGQATQSALRVHRLGTPYDSCETSFPYCGPAEAIATKTLALAPGDYDAWVHAVVPGEPWGEAQGLKFTVPVPAPVDPPPAPPAGLQILSSSASGIVIMASRQDCPRVVTSTRGSTATMFKRTVKCAR